MPVCVGIDLGTSGCRAVAIDGAQHPLAEARVELPPPLHLDGGIEQSPALWWEALETVMQALLERLPERRIDAVAVDGTSGTVLLCDDHGTPCAPALMYNDNRAVAEAGRVGQVAPADSAAHGTGAGLAKLLWLLARDQGCAARVATQGDWIGGRLCGRFGRSDANNVLKLGWDPVARRWPEWLMALGVPASLLPAVVAPGTPLGALDKGLAKQWGLSRPPLIVAGTTDSTAAVLATGASEVGDAVTSLGSTLVTKVIAERPIFAPEYGVYSQPFGEHWLVGGGSNSGGAVLRHFFSDAAMRQMSAALHPGRPTGLDYYPLLAPGERFPHNDPTLAPRLSPRPDNDVEFFQGMLEGIARIELEAYRRLESLGAPWPRSVRSVGGGAGNRAWGEMRARRLGVPMLEPEHGEAAYGAALLACRGLADKTKGRD